MLNSDYNKLITYTTVVLTDITIPKNLYYTVDNIIDYIPEGKSPIFTLLADFSSASGDIELYNQAPNKLYLRSSSGATFNKLSLKIYYC